MTWGSAGILFDDYDDHCYCYLLLFLDLFFIFLQWNAISLASSRRVLGWEKQCGSTGKRGNIKLHANWIVFLQIHLQSFGFIVGWLVGTCFGRLADYFMLVGRVWSFSRMNLHKILSFSISPLWALMLNLVMFFRSHLLTHFPSCVSNRVNWFHVSIFFSASSCPIIQQTN